MASRTKAAAVACCSILLAALACSAKGQTQLNLEQAASRQPSDFSPVYAGEDVIVQGRVSSKPIAFSGYSQVPIQEGSQGMMLEGPANTFESIVPGQELQVRGRIAVRAGLPVIVPEEIKVLASGDPPRPFAARLDELQTLRLLGQLVTAEGWVLESGETSGGAYLLIGDSKQPYKVFLPYAAGVPRSALSRFTTSHKVRVTGIASQYCPNPPYNTSFQLVLLGPDEVAVVEHDNPVQPAIVVGLFSALLAAGLLWWLREQRLGEQREMLRSIYELGEEILGSSSPQEILQKMSAVLPNIFRISRVVLYIQSRGARSLERVPGETEPATAPISVDSPAPGVETAAVTCFQNQTQLAIPDTARSPFPDGPGEHAWQAKSVLFVPLFAQGEVVGILQFESARKARLFSADEQAVAQHLGNQIGVAIKLLEQRSIREQLFRTEKLAAMGRLISGVVNELQAPLAAIANTAEMATGEHQRSVLERELRAIAGEARRAAKTVTRLISFGRLDQVETKPVELNRLVRSLIEFREREWKTRGIHVRNLLMDSPLFVLGSHGQLEQVFLNLLVFVEQALADATEKSIVLRTVLLAKRILLEISFSEPAAGDQTDPFEAAPERETRALGLGICRSILVGHGGEIRLVRRAGSDSRFEIELPWAPLESDAPPKRKQWLRDGAHSMTALVMEPDETVQRQLLALMTSRNYRVVPVRSADEGIDLAQRMRFEVAFCSVRLPGLNWVELYDRVHSQVGAFVLVADGYDPELALSFRGEGRFVLSKPIEEAQLDRILEWVENMVRRSLLQVSV